MTGRKFGFYAPFQLEWKKLQESGFLDRGKMQEFRDCAEKIRTEIPLASEYLDHPLHGKAKECRDFHLGNDVVVVYRVTLEEVQFLRIASHSEIFG